MAKILTISCSLDINSRSFLLAQQAHQKMEKRGVDCRLIDLRQFSLPVCNGFEQAAYTDPQAKELHDAILSASGVILATPIYNYGVSAACKNLVEMTGTVYGNVLTKAWRDKVLGFMAVSGSEASYMAPIHFLGSMMLDFRCVVLPRLVFASIGDFVKDNASAEIDLRVQQMTEEMHRFVSCLGRS